MIKQKMVLKYIVIIVAVISVLGIVIYKLKNSVEQNKLTKEVGGLLTDERSAEIDNKKQTKKNKIPLNLVGLNTLEVGGVDLRASNINSDDNMNLKTKPGDSGDIKKVVKIAASLNDTIELNTALVTVYINNNNKGENQDDPTMIENSNSGNEVLLKNTELKVVDLLGGNIKYNINTKPEDKTSTNIQPINNNKISPETMKKELEIIKEKSLSNNGDINTSLDNKSQEIQLSDGDIGECLEKVMGGYTFNNNNKMDKFNLEYKEMVLAILKLAALGGDELNSTSDIEKISTMWTKYKDDITNIIKKHPQDALCPILVDVKNSDLIYDTINEFLFLCVPIAVKDVLNNAFSKNVSLIKPTTYNNMSVSYENEQLQGLYYGNLQRQLWVFLGALFLINSINDCKNEITEIIKRCDDAIELIKSKPPGDDNIKYTNIDILLIAVIQITLESRKKQDPISKLILSLTEGFLGNLIALIKQYTDLCEMYNTRNTKIKPTQLINLIQKVYDGNAKSQEEEKLKQMLSL